MKTKIVKNGLHNIYGGLQMLSESKTSNLSALAEISILLSDPHITDYHRCSKKVNTFLSSIHFLLNGLNKESVSIVTNFINGMDHKELTEAIDYKSKYEGVLEELYLLHKELRELKKKNK